MSILGNLIISPPISNRDATVDAWPSLYTGYSEALQQTDACGCNALKLASTRHSWLGAAERKTVDSGTERSIKLRSCCVLELQY